VDVQNIFDYLQFGNMFFFIMNSCVLYHSCTVIMKLTIIIYHHHSLLFIIVKLVFIFSGISHIFSMFSFQDFVDSVIFCEIK